MYPVYRGWTTESDVVIQVGVGEERREFRGPRQQLAEQSGYIKSLLESSPTNEISVPSVSPQIFSHILRYVSTGYLDLNPENVYAVLLATHILHMPRAVDICRAYLLREQTEQQSRLPILVKPIPSRKFLPTLYWPPPPIIPPPAFYAPPSATTGHIPVDPLPSTSLLTNLPETAPVQNQAQKQSPQTPQKKSKEVVRDIACCDGPVRFKRVLNTNYGSLSENPTQDESMNDGKQLYICGFCKHTFKSHYCYRKHTRRHINPVPVKPVESESRDMNVQYYPCKTCGSKFPSYYFVHKHRKMCHVNESDIDEKVSQNSVDCSKPITAP